MGVHKYQYHLILQSEGNSRRGSFHHPHFTKRIADNENIWKLICINFPKNADYNVLHISVCYDERVARNFQHIKIVVASQQPHTDKTIKLIIMLILMVSLLYALRIV